MNLVNVPASIAYLEALCVTPQSAIEALQGISSGIDFYALFEHFFPRQFKAAVSSAKMDYIRRQSAITASFLQLVHERMFPLPDVFLDELEEYDIGMWIPLSPANEDWWEMEVDCLPQLDRAILQGMGIIEGKSYSQDYPMVPHLDYGALAKKCRGLLNGLPDAVRVVAHDTGNDWIDMTWEEAGGSSVEWTVKTLAYLADEWKKAQTIFGRVRPVYRWVENNAARLERVRALVAGVVIPREPERVKVRTR